MMSGKKTALTSKRYFFPFLLITSLFFLWGFSRAILDVLNKHFQNEMDISITQSSWIQVTTYLGYFLMALPAGFFINRYGYRRGVVMGLLLFGLGALLFVPCALVGTFTAFLSALFVIGCGLVFLETSANPYVTELGDASTATSRLNFAQSFNGVGSLMGALLVGQFLFRGRGGDVEIPYLLLGIVVLLIAFMFSRVELPEIRHVEVSTSMHFSALFKRKDFLLGFFALLAYEVAEISINSYFINFVTGKGWLTDRVASMLLTLALAFFMVGRFVGSWLMRFISPHRMLIGCALGSVVSMLVLLGDFGKLSVVALMGNYLCEAVMFPTIFALALSGLGPLTKSGSAMLMMSPIGGCGFFFMGMIADHVGMVAPFLVPLVGYLVVLFFAMMQEKRIACQLSH